MTQPSDHAAPPHKAVILARGLGTRMRAEAAAELGPRQAAVAKLGVKAMMPLGEQGHAFIEHVITALADAGLTDVCLVIGPEHQLVRDWVAELPTDRVHISFAVQTEPLGTADAVRACREWAGDERFVMVNSDNHYPSEGLRELVAAPGTALLGFDAPALVAQSNIPAERVARFAVLDIDDAGHLSGILEKPTPEEYAARGEHVQVSMNCFCFGPSIFEACAAIEPSVRGEYEIVDAVRHLLAAGEPVTVVPVALGVLDMSGRADVAAVEQALAGHEVRL